MINGSACLDIPVSEEFGGGDYKVAALPVHQMRREAAAPQVTN